MMKSFLVFILVFVQVVTAVAGPPVSDDLNGQSEKSPALILNLGGANNDTQFAYKEIPLEDPSQLNAFLQNKETLNSDVLLSTDNAETYTAVATAIQENEKVSDRKFRFIPIGKLAAAQEKLAAGWASYKANAANTFQFDKLGLSIVVITTSYDSFIWIHSASMDVYQKSAMVMMNIVFSAAFGLDRDLWAKMTVPIRHKIIDAFDKLSGKSLKSGELNSNEAARRVIASQFLANLTFSVGFQFLRQSIISMHDLTTTLSTMHFWTMSLEVAAITTLASFAWGELLAAANAEKNPVAKNALKRIADVRNIVMSQLASMGMVLQPSVYGFSPIVAIIASGSVGLLALVKSNKVIEWLENNSVMKTLYRKQRKYENLINEASTMRGGGLSCGQLFN
ncbi:hypothetical protein CIK05_09485 [Bdellovibrio sp. qaytius]|nr:hypothetical protein CIK05_09485 [Bdellovibrio sp. qaytius]